jgi:hypothetical protein
LCSYISSNNKESRNKKEAKKKKIYLFFTAQGFQTNLPFGKYDKAAFFLEYHVAGVHASVGWLLERGTDTRPPTVISDVLKHS